MKCPCCGTEVARVDPAYVNVHGTHQRKIFELLRNNFGKEVSYQSIINELYSLDPNGGPTNALLTIRVMFSKLRHQLKPYGLVIFNLYGGYMLCWTDMDDPPGGTAIPQSNTAIDSHDQN